MGDLMFWFHGMQLDRIELHKNLSLTLPPPHRWNWTHMQINILFRIKRKELDTIIDFQVWNVNVKEARYHYSITSTIKYKQRGSPCIDPVRKEIRAQFE